MSDKKKDYIVVTGLDSGRKRMEPGDAYAGSEKSLPWLIEQGHVVEEGSAEHKALQAQLAAEDED